MKLTKGEFCQFNLKSKINLLKNNGTLLMNKKVDEMNELKLFLIYDFYVEALYNNQENKVIKIEPILNQNWVSVYLDE